MRARRVAEARRRRRGRKRVQCRSFSRNHPELTERAQKCAGRRSCRDGGKDIQNDATQRTNDKQTDDINGMNVYRTEGP